MYEISHIVENSTISGNQQVDLLSDVILCQLCTCDSGRPLQRKYNVLRRSMLLYFNFYSQTTYIKASLGQLINIYPESGVTLVSMIPLQVLFSFHLSLYVFCSYQTWMDYTPKVRHRPDWCSKPPCLTGS